MAKKATPKQLAARKKFVAAVKAGKFKKAAKKKKSAPKKKRAKKTTKKKSSKKTTRATALKSELKNKGLRMPHGYELVARKKKK